MNTKTILYFTKLGNDAKCINEADYASVRQQNAENKFWIELQKVLVPTKWEKLETYALKATIEESVAYALRLLVEQK